MAARSRGGPAGWSAKAVPKEKSAHLYESVGTQGRAAASRLSRPSVFRRIQTSVPWGYFGSEGYRDGAQVFSFDVNGCSPLLPINQVRESEGSAASPPQYAAIFSRLRYTSTFEL
jgi:hypothetical protein